MGDISELSGLIVVVTFLGSLIIFIALIPSQFLYSAEEGRDVVVPEQFECPDVYSFADVENHTITNATLGNSGIHDFGGWMIDVVWWGNPAWGPLKVWIERWDSWWVFSWLAEKGVWYSLDGMEIGNDMFATRLDDDYNENGIEGLKYHCQFDGGGVKPRFYCYLWFNDTTYNDPTEAWLDNKLYLLLGLNFDDVNTSYNVWTIIGQLLFFQLPNIHWIINALISIPIWVTVAYLIYVLIIKIIPFIAGG